MAETMSQLLAKCKVEMLFQIKLQNTADMPFYMFCR